MCICSISKKCEAIHNNIVKVYSKSWYEARRDCKIINNVETVSSAKKKKKQYVGF